MEGIGSEVSHKIRAAIKAKLIELGAYVDDELPDYIMVMVANKRTRAQMDEDLQLFLSSNTKIFTSWLHTVLQKLQEVTVATFESKKELDKKSVKPKKPETDDVRSRKSSEETVDKVKKHSKKHKDIKKSKKNKHKTKEKIKTKKPEVNQEENKEKLEKEDEKKTSQDKNSKNKKVALNEAVGRAILGDLKKNKKPSDKPLSESNSSTNDESPSNGKDKKNIGNVSAGVNKAGVNKAGDNKAGVNKAGVNKAGVNKAVDNKAGDEVLNVAVPAKPLGGDVDSSKKNKEVIKDEFNIEPLKPTEKDIEIETPKADTRVNVKSKEMESHIQVEKTISAPTEELLKQHDKIQSEKFEGKSKVGEKTKPKSDSEESLSPEEIRKQLLLSRAKKKLEESKKAERMRSNSPDVMILEETSLGLGGRQKDLLTASSRQPEVRTPRSAHSGVKESSRTGSPRRSRQQSSLHSERFGRRSHSPERSPCKRAVQEYKPKAEVKNPNEEKRKITFGKCEREGEKKKNVIKISESLQMEKNLGIKRDSREVTRKRPVPSRVVTITCPETPEIPSIVKVKPREFISKDKQANKALILKAVADAEKSIATVQARPEIEAEPKKEALYTKTLREKRYEKLAITLSNIRRSPDSRDKLERRVSIGSEKSEKKRDSSDISDGVRLKSDFSKKISKSEDQFISSKTTIMEKNDKYIRCWLEGVEKAVKDDVMVNPSEMEDLIHSNLTDDENNLLENEDERKRKRKATDSSAADISSKALKLSEKEIAKLRVLPNSGIKKPQIVVTLDGIDSKALKDLILKNKEATGRPLLSSTKNKNSAVPVEKNPLSDTRKSGLEKISDRFGRLNRTNEDEPGRGEKKHPETEKKDKLTNESKNRQLIAQLSEKFGKVDREFENRKRKRPDDDRRCSYESRRSEKEDNERNGRYKKSERRSFREGNPAPFSSQLCKFHPACKNTECRYFHPKKCKIDEDCTKSDCKRVHLVEKKSKWHSKS